jgi:hypothetical protein
VLQLVLSAALGVAGCASDHHVSPWPKDVSLKTLMQATTVEEHLARVDDEMGVEGLMVEAEIKGEFEDGEPYCIRSYAGRDSLGNLRRAVRVATRYGVVMALGPTSSHDALRGNHVQLVTTLAEGRWRSGSDLNGDGLPDVVVTRSSGGIEIWGLHAKGASPYPVEAIVPVTEATDVDGDGRPDLVGVVPVPKGDGVAPHLVEVATFLGGEYRTDTPSVRSWHARKLRERTTKRSPASSVERAWHGIRAGQDRERLFDTFDDEIGALGDLPANEGASLARWRRWLESDVAVSRRREDGWSPSSEVLGPSFLSDQAREAVSLSH